MRLLVAAIIGAATIGQVSADGFYGAAGTANFYPAFFWNCRTIPSLAAWYDASNAGSITSSGGKVSQWNDLSANANNLTQGTSADQPTITAGALANKSTITFNGSSDVMSLTSTINMSSTGYSVAVVTTQNNASTYSYVGFGGGTNQSLEYGYSNNSFGAAWTSGYTYESVGTTGYADYLVSVPANGSGVAMYYNGASENVTNNSSSNVISAITEYGYSTSEAYGPQTVAEVCLYSTSLTPSQAAILHMYFTYKWGE